MSFGGTDDFPIHSDLHQFRVILAPQLADNLTVHFHSAFKNNALGCPT